MPRLLLALPLLLAACQTPWYDASEDPNAPTKAERCAAYQRTIDVMTLRLQDPVYLQDEDKVALAKRAILDAELLMVLGGCPTTI